MSSLLSHWFIADLHLGHRNVLRHDSRPWDAIDQHDEDITHNCESPGMKSRTLWILGDVATRKEQLFPFLDRMIPKWGKVILIRGNHDDRVAWKYRDMFTEAHESRYLRVDKEVKVYLSHYAHRVWRNSHHGSFHLHGHSHGALPTWGRSMDVGAPCVDYRPISLAAIVRRLTPEAPINHH